MCLYMYVCMYERMCVCVYDVLPECVYVCVYVCAYAYMLYGMHVCIPD